MKIQKETRVKIGFTIGLRSLGKSILVGIFFGIIFEPFATYFTTPLFSQFFGVQPNLSEFQMVKGNFEENSNLFATIDYFWAVIKKI